MAMMVMMMMVMMMVMMIMQVMMLEIMLVVMLVMMKIAIFWLLPLKSCFFFFEISFAAHTLRVLFLYFCCK